MRPQALGVALTVVALLPCRVAAEEGASRRYASTDPDLPMAFDCPADWTLTEEQGLIEQFQSVRLRGPRNAEDSYTAYLVVRSFPLVSAGGKRTDAAAFMSRQLGTLTASAVVESRKPRQVGGLAGEELIVTATVVPLGHRRVAAASVHTPVRTRTVVVERPPQLYELAFSADAREYPRLAEAFERLLASFEWR